MPKLKRSETKIKESYLTGMIKKYQMVMDLPVAKLSPMVGIPGSTLYLKIKEPWRLTYKDLYMIIMVLHIPPEEYLQCFTFRESA